MSNTSLSGGYILPKGTQELPRGLSLLQFIQTVLVGLSGLPGTLVRPDWQPEPPQQPDIMTNWLAFGITTDNPDTYSYVGVNESNIIESKRQEGLEINCQFYGPASLEYYTLVRDGFQIQQNLDGLRSANMGFTEMNQALHVPDLVNGRWFNRYQTTLFLRRQVQRTYPVLTLLSANGTIHTVLGTEEYLIDWDSGT